MNSSAAEFIAMRRGSGNSFTFAACSFQKQKRIIPPLGPRPSYTPASRRIRAKLEKNFPVGGPGGDGGSDAFNALRNTTAADLIGLTLRGKYGRNQGNAFMRDLHDPGYESPPSFSPPSPLFNGRVR